MYGIMKEDLKNIFQEEKIAMEITEMETYSFDCEARFEVSPLKYFKLVYTDTKWGLK